MSEIVSGGPLDRDHAGVPVGVELARIRRRKGMTGTELGRRAGMSQAKVSKIETGSVLPSAHDVESLARALGVPAEQARALATRAETAQNQMTDWRLRAGGLAAGQRELASVEATTTLFRLFQPAVVAGLLQTTEYARSVLGAVARERAAADAAAESVAEAVTARVQRQEALADPGKRFAFLMTESVLQHLVCPPVDMPAQIERLREVGGQENVTIAFLPASARLAYPPLHPFSLFDDRMVLVDVLNTFLTSRGRADLGLYARVFEALWEQATTDIEPLLDRYQRTYLDLSRSRLTS